MRTHYKARMTSDPSEPDAICYDLDDLVVLIHKLQASDDTRERKDLAERARATVGIVRKKIHKLRAWGAARAKSP